MTRPGRPAAEPPLEGIGSCLRCRRVVLAPGTLGLVGLARGPTFAERLEVALYLGADLVRGQGIAPPTPSHRCVAAAAASDPPFEPGGRPDHARATPAPAPPGPVRPEGGAP